MESDFVEKLTTLGHPQRLAVFRMLVRRFPDAVPAGEIGAALGLKPSTLSVYLAALRRAGLVMQERQGTWLLYSANMAGAQDLIRFLFEDCCRGRPDCCLPSDLGRGSFTDMTDRRYAVLFICTGNSARSIFAEAILREIGGDRFDAYSAGVRPHSELNPYALEVLKGNGHDVSVLRAKNIAEFQGEDAPWLDFVFTVCDQAANEECPAWPDQPLTAHWGVPDPVKATGNPAERRLAFREAYKTLRHRIQLFAALNVAALDRVSLQRQVDDLGRTREVQ